MRPPKALPADAPFITFYTNTFMRPESLVRCMKSVALQTARERIEQIVIPDHVGYGIVGGLWGRIPWYADAVHGRYVSLLCDDDYLVKEDVVAKVEAFAEKKSYPEVIVVRVIKKGLELPSNQFGRGGPPEAGEVDLCNSIVRADIWKRHIADYGPRYEGDFDHALALYNAGYRHEFCDLLFIEGGVSSGRPEVDWR